MTFNWQRVPYLFVVLCIRCTLYSLHFVFVVLCIRCTLYSLYFVFVVHVFVVLCIRCTLYSLYFVFVVHVFAINMFTVLNNHVQIYKLYRHTNKSSIPPFNDEE